MKTERVLRQARVGIASAVTADLLLISILAPFQSKVGLLNEGLLFLLLTLLISAVWGWRVGLFAAILTNLSLNFFFVAPLHTLTVREPANYVALVVFLIVSVVGGTLLSSARAATEEARRRAAETEVLIRLSRALIGQTDAHAALEALCNEVVHAFSAPGAAVLGGGAGTWVVHASAGSETASRPMNTQERSIAQRALDTGTVSRAGYTGLSTSRRPRIVAPAGTRGYPESSPGVAFVPLRLGGGTVGVLRLDGPIGDTAFRERPDRLLAAFAGEAALGVQRAELAQAAAHADALILADEMKSALMTSISHDLKTPLAGIKTSVSSLLDESIAWTPEDRSAFLQTIDSQADRLNRVISDILDLNRIESGIVTPTLRGVNARALLAEVREQTAMVTGGRLVTIEASADLVLQADESLITQALVNLVENAAKYSRTGGAIHLIAAEAGERAEIIVDDDGPGIAAGDLPHVFERFYRAAEQSRRVKGSGLGLAIVKGFVGLSAGTVRVERTGAGTRFVISLPAVTRCRAHA
ncbi:MAG: DUF4118 domain-containing protein [Chloroflexi bacterium]|nr:DUF4118 domain-containing protein [Chloroflexota bacterium]